MASAQLRRNREISGPGLMGPGIIAKPTLSRPPEHLILSRRADNLSRRPYEDNARDVAFVQSRLEFEEIGDKRIKETQVSRIANGILADEQSRLEQRRAQLKEQLDAEEASYMQEAESTAETPLDRQAKMRTRARELRDKREDIRQRMATQKLDAAWTQNCEALRTLVSRKNHERIDIDRKTQVLQNTEMAKRDQWVEEMYAESWRLDQEAKKLRESALVARRREESRHCVEVLDAQCAMIEMNRAEEQELQAKEQTWRLEAAKLAAEEDRLQEEAVVLKKKRVKAMLDDDVRQKGDEREQREQEELARDLALLDQLEAEKLEMGEAMVERKKQLIAETASYRQYIADCQQAERERDTMIDDFMEQERKREARKRHGVRKAEKKKRAEMMLDVIEVLQQQMQFNWNQMMQARAEKQNEARQMLFGITQLNHQAEAKEMQIAQENKLHQTKLVGQIHENAYVRQREVEAETSFVNTLLDNHQAEEKKINDAINRVATLDMSVSGNAMF